MVASMSTIAMCCTMTAARRVAIVTGGTRGIGFGIAEAFASRGYDLLLTYQSDQKTADVQAGRLEHRYGCDVVCVHGDLSEEATRDTVFDLYDRVFARANCTLAAMVHNAGQYLGVTAGNARGMAPAGHLAFGDGSLVDDDTGRVQLAAVKYYQRLYGDAFIDLCERACVRMDDGGSLVGISSPGCTLQYKPQPGYDLPGTGKCVMEYAMRLVALRAANRRINCNVVVPGVTHTDAWDRIAAARHGVDGADLVHNMSAALAPLGPTTPDAVGEVVAFLCSPEGACITGVSLPADNGVHLKA